MAPLALFGLNNVMKPTLALLVVTLAAAPARAGIYNTTDNGDMALSRNIDKFIGQTLAPVRSIGMDGLTPDLPLYYSPLRKRYLLMEALGGARPPATLSLEEKLDYSAVLIRRKKYQEAIDFLMPINRQHPEIFLFDAHLAMAYWLSGQPGYDRRAVEAQTALLSRSGWPERFDEVKGEAEKFLTNSMGWRDSHPFDPYRKAEVALLRLMKNRLGESKTVPFKTVDPLFGDPKDPVRYVGESGKYEPGAIAVLEKRKLPGDALETVEQLLLWLPDDTRLLWQLAELSAAEGKSAPIRAAKNVLESLVFDMNVPADELREHRRMMNDHVENMPPEQDENFPEFPKRIKVIENMPDSPPLSTRTIAIIFATGFAAGVFAIWQYQELRRRRRRDPVAAGPNDSNQPA